MIFYAWVFLPQEKAIVSASIVSFISPFSFFNNKSEALFRVATGQPVSLTLVWWSYY